MIVLSFSVEMSQLVNVVERKSSTCMGGSHSKMSLLFKIDEEDVSIVECGWLQVVDEVHELHLEQDRGFSRTVHVR